MYVNIDICVCANIYTSRNIYWPTPRKCLEECAPN